MAHIITSTGLLPARHIVFSQERYYIAGLRVSQLNIGVVGGGGVPGPMGREFMGWRDWDGRVGGWFRVGKNQQRKPVNSSNGQEAHFHLPLQY